MKKVLVIGAGPAGLAAANSARKAGATVVLLDSSDSLGGQFWRHLPAERSSKKESILHHGWKKFLTLASALESDIGVRVVREAHVWALETHNGIAVNVIIGEPDGSRRQQEVFTSDAVILATGAHDRTLPFPGWDLPGVVTGGGAQALAKGERIAIGQRVLVCGAGPFLLPVAQSLVRVGARVLGVLEANRLSALGRGWLPKPWQLVGAASKGVELAGYVYGQLRHQIPYRTGQAVIAAHGADRVESVTTARLNPDWSPIAGTEKTVSVDAVCVSHGFTPRLELALAAGCRLTPDRFVEVDHHQLTSVPSVYAVGEITGIGGVDLALAEGEIAGAHAASSLKPTASALRRRRIFTRFADRIESAHGIRDGWTGWLTDSTMICRCEEVSCGTLRKVSGNTGSESLRSLKLTTRAGLGICQGRVCGRTVEHLLATSSPSGALKDDASTDRRPLTSSLRLGELADRASHTSQ